MNLAALNCLCGGAGHFLPSDCPVRTSTPTTRWVAKARYLNRSVAMEGAVVELRLHSPHPVEWITDN